MYICILGVAQLLLIPRHVRVYMSIYIYIYTYIYIYVWVYTYVYTYIHICIDVKKDQTRGGTHMKGCSVNFNSRGSIFSCLSFWILNTRGYSDRENKTGEFFFFGGFQRKSLEEEDLFFWKDWGCFLMGYLEISKQRKVQMWQVADLNKSKSRWKTGTIKTIFTTFFLKHESNASGSPEMAGSLNPNNFDCRFRKQVPNECPTKKTIDLEAKKTIWI